MNDFEKIPLLRYPFYSPLQHHLALISLADWNLPPHGVPARPGCSAQRSEAHPLRRLTTDPVDY